MVGGVAGAIGSKEEAEVEDEVSDDESIVVGTGIAGKEMSLS